jgi:hypothetical protein
MFACFSGFDSPRNVKLVGQWSVNGVDSGVGEQLLIRAIGRRNAKSGRCLSGFSQITRCNRNNGGVFSLLHCREHFLETYICGAENSPAKLGIHSGMIQPAATGMVPMLLLASRHPHRIGRA